MTCTMIQTEYRRRLCMCRLVITTCNSEHVDHVVCSIWINRVRLPISAARISLTGRMFFSLSPFAPENLTSQDRFGRPSRVSLLILHTQDPFLLEKLGRRWRSYSGPNISPSNFESLYYARWDCRTRLGRPNSQARTRTGKYSFSLFS